MKVMKISLILAGLLGISTLSSCVQKDAFSFEWQVSQLSDGDTFTATANGQEEIIRLCGIDAPEREQPMGSKSKAHLGILIAPGDTVLIAPVARDREGHLVAEVFVPQAGEGEIHINSQMVIDGMAYVYGQSVDDCPNAEAIKRSGSLAQNAKTGVWSGNYQKPWDYRKTH